MTSLLYIQFQCYKGLLGSRGMGYFAEACVSGCHRSMPSCNAAN